MKRIDSRNVLTLGNSFTNSLVLYFQTVAESAGCKLLFDRANHGGCELHRHWQYISDEEKDGNYRMYQNNQFRFREILANTQWDIVTIQQASHYSWRPETFQPYASYICDYIRRYAPQAEIRIQQTWAYNCNDPRIMPGGEWGFDQRGMYERLTAAYRKLAKEQGLKIIPAGFAVQLARELGIDKEICLEKDFRKNFHYPDLPVRAGNLVGNMNWRKNKTDGTMEIGFDTIHLSPYGQYLQACVWFAALYDGHTTDEITFVPDDMSQSEAEFLKKTAQKAVNEFTQEI